MPDWKDAPEWAQWLAQDSDGEWYWFACEPSIECGTYYSGGPCAFAGNSTTLHERPTA